MQPTMPPNTTAYGLPPIITTSAGYSFTPWLLVREDGTPYHKMHCRFPMPSMDPTGNMSLTERAILVCEPDATEAEIGTLNLDDYLKITTSDELKDFIHSQAEVWPLLTANHPVPLDQNPAFTDILLHLRGFVHTAAGIIGLNDPMDSSSEESRASTSHE